MKSHPPAVECGTLRLMVIVIKRSAAVMGRERFQTKSQVSCNFLLDFRKPFISLMWASGNFSCFVIVAKRHDTYASRIPRLLFIGDVSIGIKVTRRRFHILQRVLKRISSTLQISFHTIHSSYLKLCESYFFRVGVISVSYDHHKENKIAKSRVNMIQSN